MAYIIIETCEDGSYDDVALRGCYKDKGDAVRAMHKMFEHRRTHPIFCDMEEYDTCECGEDYASCGWEYEPTLHQWYVWSTDETFELIWDEEEQ